MYLVLSCRQIIYLTGPTLPWVARSEIEILGDSKELENVLTLSWPFVLIEKPNLPWNIEQTNQMNLAFYKDNYKISVNTAVYVHAAVFTMCWNPFWRGSILFLHAPALGLLLNLPLHEIIFCDLWGRLRWLSSVRFKYKPGYKPCDPHVINLIPLTGWNYSIQTGENISTNESTRIYNRSHGL